MSAVSLRNARGRNTKGGYMRVAGIFARVMAAIFGGYGLAVLCSVALAMVLPMSRADAVLTGMLVGLVVHAGSVVWVFAAPSALRAWAGMFATAVLFAVMTMLAHWHSTGRMLP